MTSSCPVLLYRSPLQKRTFSPEWKTTLRGLSYCPRWSHSILSVNPLITGHLLPVPCTKVAQNEHPKTSGPTTQQGYPSQSGGVSFASKKTDTDGQMVVRHRTTEVPRSPNRRKMTQRTTLSITRARRQVDTSLSVITGDIRLQRTLHYLTFIRCEVYNDDFECRRV